MPPLSFLPTPSFPRRRESKMLTLGGVLNLGGILTLGEMPLNTTPFTRKSPPIKIPGGR
ncbi:MAG: hypothetical protein HAW59_01240 [Betaproteobacteria bacterium]|nr:hypothetical protein [Betaproteobacteria bacterium]